MVLTPVQGIPCYVRVACCNMKGIGDPVASTPPFLIPSDWRDVINAPNRLVEFQKQVLDISDQSVSCLLVCPPSCQAASDRAAEIRADAATRAGGEVVVIKCPQ